MDFPVFQPTGGCKTRARLATFRRGGSATFLTFIADIASENAAKHGHWPCPSALASSYPHTTAAAGSMSDFHQEAAADTTLRKLHDYIRDCSAVVCIIGQRSGAMPPAASAVPFAHMLPSGVTEASAVVTGTAASADEAAVSPKEEKLPPRQREKRGSAGIIARHSAPQHDPPHRA
jgi:hypothetical protein